MYLDFVCRRLRETSYDPLMLPEVVMYQRWQDLLFIHWEVDPEMLRSRVPAGLELDLFDGHAWVALIPFTMTGIRTRFLPPVPGLTALHEINLRTYVSHPAGAGVWFFSLDATSRIAVEAARAIYHLPYHHARITMERSREWIDYRAKRLSGDEHCEVRYRGIGPAQEASPGSLEHFLIERYRLFATAGDRLWSAKVYHEPYEVQSAETSGIDESFLASTGLRSMSPSPMLHYSRGVSVRIGRLDRL